MAVQFRVAAVTGANKGIGLAIVRNLALTYPSSPLRSGPLLIYLCARSASRGAEAVKTLQNDPQLKQAKVLAEDGGDTTITFHEFDVSDKSSIHAFRDFLQKEHPDGIDVLINNAGIAMEGFDSNVVKQTLATNYYGTLEATQSILPLIRDGGRLVNVSSMAGKLNKYTPELRDAFTSASQSGVPDCTALMQDFTSAVEAGKEKEQGWPSAAYAVSKAGTTAFTKAIAAEEDKKGRGVLVNACCPGYVNTDMTKGNGVKTPDQGAKTPVMLGLEDFGGSSGGFWQSEKIIEWLNITIANEANPILLCRTSACPEDIVSIISIHTRAVSLATYQFRLSR
ncbi:NAD(P)-binding protein [Aureobasidium pullulans]|nr:NAD(P)-binding protein [Aureobasidium pullulans]